MMYGTISHNQVDKYSLLSSFWDEAQGNTSAPRPFVHPSAKVPGQGEKC